MVLNVNKLSIRTLLLGGIGGLMTLAIGIVLITGLYTARTNTVSLLRQSVGDTMSAMAELTKAHLLPAEETVHAVVDHLQATDLILDDATVEQLRMTMIGIPQLRGLGIFLDTDLAVRISRDGLVFRGSLKEANFDFDRMRDAMLMHEPSWGRPVWVIEIGETVVFARMPIIIDGQTRGLVTAAITTRDLSRYLDHLSADVGTAFIMDSENRLIAHPKIVSAMRPMDADGDLPTVSEIEDHILSVWVRGDADQVGILEHVSNSMNADIVRTDDGEFVIVTDVLSGLKPQTWTLGVAVSTAATDVFFRRLVSMGLAGLAVLGLTLLALMWLAREIRRPVTALSVASERIRRLDLDPRPTLPSTRISELDDASAAFDRMVTALLSFESYVPRRLVYRIIRDGNDDGLAPRTRQVTVMFTDIVGFTTLSETLSAGEVAAILNDHFSLIAKCVEAEDGTIDKYIGDSVMAFWGAPSKQPDHAARALRAVRAIATAISAENARRRAVGERETRIRIGLHSGPALAGNIGAPGRINYTLVGDTVNAANRLEQLGKDIVSNVGSSGVGASDVGASDVDVIALASADTMALGSEAAGLSIDDCPSVGPVHLRGRAQPVTVHRVV
jgi:class 3 adenylate cyclase